MAKQKFDPNSMIVSRGLVYARVTGRYLGPQGDFDMDGGGDEGLASLNMGQLKDRARELEIVGFSSMNKSALIEAIEAVESGGAEPDEVADEVGDDGSDQTQE